jgi:hypothetical protein
MKIMKSLTGAVLSVLLILWVEIMESVCHYVLGIDSFLNRDRNRLHQFLFLQSITKYLQTARDTLHGDCATA